MTLSWRTWSSIAAAALVATAPLVPLLVEIGEGGAVTGWLLWVLAAAVVPACYLAVTGVRLPAPSGPWFLMTLLSKSLSVAVVTALLVLVAQRGPFAVLGIVVLVPAGIGALGTLLLRRGLLWGLLPSLLSALACAWLGLMSGGGALGQPFFYGLGWEFLLGSVMLIAVAVQAAPARRGPDFGDVRAASPQRVRGSDRRFGCATAVIVTAVGVGVLGVRFCVGVYDQYNPPMPDVKGIAASPAVVQSDTGTTASIDDAFGRLRTAVPSTTSAGTLVDDYCETDDQISAFGERPSFKPVSCHRSVVWVGAFDGDPGKESRLVSGQLIHEGWALNGSGSTVLFAHRDDNGLAVEVDFWARPTVPVLYLPEVPQGAGGVPSAAPGTVPSGVVFRDLRVPSLAELTTTAFQHHDHVITVEITSHYFTQSPAPPVQPAPPVHAAPPVPPAPPVSEPLCPGESPSPTPSAPVPDPTGTGPTPEGSGPDFAGNNGFRTPYTLQGQDRCAGRAQVARVTAALQPLSGTTEPTLAQIAARLGTLGYPPGAVTLTPDGSGRVDFVIDLLPVCVDGTVNSPYLQVQAHGGYPDATGCVPRTGGH
ncbi:hypothetical protein [Streptacidiphilus sp. EB129]|uniref:hypothetical protein n=1 Tax=Streptacidiphilus sp. EB129 TaxID=3156262 RepID=UPI00351440E9